jgi:hypothetical protein
VFKVLDDRSRRVDARSAAMPLVDPALYSLQGLPPRSAGRVGRRQPRHRGADVGVVPLHLRRGSGRVKRTRGLIGRVRPARSLKAGQPR